MHQLSVVVVVPVILVVVDLPVAQLSPSFTSKLEVTKFMWHALFNLQQIFMFATQFYWQFIPLSLPYLFPYVSSITILIVFCVFWLITHVSKKFHLELFQFASEDESISGQATWGGEERGGDVWAPSGFCCWGSTIKQFAEHVENLMPQTSRLNL